MNHLGSETSPYLLQHAANPVHWYPWAPAALERARDENKPLLLSIGYAACHWCHVMAHESFEDDAIAGLMNEHFVSIKVDREERPDLDSIYQSALALLGEHGGWPLTMFCAPTGEPFWGGTYFPPTPRYGRPGFPQILTRIAEVYRDDPDRVTSSTSAIMSALRGLSAPTATDPIPLATLDAVAEQITHIVDPHQGGLKGAPKFPQPTLFALLWRAYRRTGKSRYRTPVDLILTRMAQGGIYDHLGGGFARYSVDAHWLVPHFEKMLYDNALLLELYSHAWQATRHPLYAQRTEETIDWLQRDMRGPHGAFHAAIDADSEGEEGKFYVWSPAEIEQYLGPDATLFKLAYDVRPGGNWEGKTILNRSHVKDLDQSNDPVLAPLRAKLLAARAKRTPPALDDKTLADWNGLAIAGLATAATAFDRPEWLDLAAAAFAFVVSHMQQGDRLHHSWRAGRHRHPATLDDHANMSRAALLLHEATGEDRYLMQAETWVSILHTHFWDRDAGGYFFSADDTTDVITRTKTALDHATPAGNGTMVEVLARLHYLTGRDAYRAHAEEISALYAADVEKNAFGYAALLNGVDVLLRPIQIVLAGARDDPALRRLTRIVFDLSLPNRILTICTDPTVLPPHHPAAGKAPIDGVATAFVCRGQTCSLPITDTAALQADLSQT